MEQKKFDLNSTIGFALIFLIIMWMMYTSQKSAEKQQVEKAKQEQIQKQEKAKQVAQKELVTTAKDTSIADTVKLQKLQASLGNFAYSATLPSAKNDFTILENNVLKLKIANKGGFVTEAILKKHEKFKKNSGQLVELINKNNSNLNLELNTTDNRVLNSKDLYFEPKITTSGTDKILSMKLKTSENEFLEYRYTLHENDYLLDFNIISNGLSKAINTSKPANLVWDLKAFRNERSITYENQYSEIYFEYEGDKIDYVGQGENKEENPEDLNFVAFKQHFFTSILSTETPIKNSKLQSNNLVLDSAKDTLFTKQFKATMPLAFNGNELNYKMNWYFGPADYKLLKSYDKNFEEVIPLGWGIFGWINSFIFVPLFGFLGSFMSYGIAIILFTIIIKIAMSPITFKSFLSQAKMKVLRPEIMELNEKFSKDPMKKQQETMKLYGKAGVNPMAGCIPALIQMPFLIASFRFFPSAFELRQKGFLWADDLSSFDQIAKLPFNIPFYGDHVSLFPILAAIAIFFYMKMTSGDQTMAQPPQEGMPDMGKIMKIMIYLSPIMMLIFFNSYGSGLSLYNFISNLITIGIMVVIKKYFIDSDKIHAQIQENKQKPKTESKFQKKMREMMEQAEAQKANQKKK